LLLRGDIVHEESGEIDEGIRPAGYENGDEAGASEAEPESPESDGPAQRGDETAETDSSIPGTDRVLEAFETAVEFMCGSLDDPLPEDCDVDAETPREYFEEGRGWDSETIEEKRLADEDLVTVREGAAKHGATVFDDCDANLEGVVDISATEIAKSYGSHVCGSSRFQSLRTREIG
jgi:hypothetical protein